MLTLLFYSVFIIAFVVLGKCNIRRLAGVVAMTDQEDEFDT